MLTKKSAPAARASSCRPSYRESTMTLISGQRDLIPRVASRPSISGMRMSIRVCHKALQAAGVAAPPTVRE